jgi:hypothetical protein
MKARLEKPWLLLEDDSIARVPAHLGVYQLADEIGRVLFIGYAGGRSLFGLRGEIASHLGSDALQFRYESNMQYLTRYRELLMLHIADYGELPPMNPADIHPKLGRLR